MSKSPTRPAQKTKTHNGIRSCHRFTFGPGKTITGFHRSSDTTPSHIYTAQEVVIRYKTDEESKSTSDTNTVESNDE